MEYGWPLFTWLPLIGDLLAVALGFYKIKPYASAIYMLIGRFARFLLWTWLYLQYGERFFKLSLLPPPLTISTIFFLFSCSRRFICRHRFIRFHRPNNFPSPLYVFVRARSNLCKWDMTFIILATTEFWEHYGYLGLFAGSFLSALFIPLGADLLYVSMLAMGFNPWLCLFRSDNRWLDRRIGDLWSRLCRQCHPDTEIIPYQRRTIAETEK